MTPYGNAEGSSIRAYRITDEGIDILFKNGQVYSYTEGYNDDVVIGIMRELAQSGSGLNSFINREKPVFS